MNILSRDVKAQIYMLAFFPAPVISIGSFSSSIRPAGIKGASSEELSVDGVFRQDVTSEWVWISLENCYSHLQMPKSHQPQNCEKRLLNRQALHRYSESNQSQLVLHWVIIRVFAFCNIHIVKLGWRCVALQFFNLPGVEMLKFRLRFDQFGPFCAHQTKWCHPPGPRSRDGHAQCCSSEPSSSTKEALALCKSQHNEVVHELEIPFYTTRGNLWILKVQTQRSCVFRTACHNVDIRSYWINLYESFHRWQVRLS